MTDYSNPSEVEWAEHCDRIAEDQDEHGYVQEHHVETFIDDRGSQYGWQCFTCSAEGEDYESFASAEQDGQKHAEVSA